MGMSSACVLFAYRLVTWTVINVLLLEVKRKIISNIGSTWVTTIGYC